MMVFEINEIEAKMGKTLENLAKELGNIHAGRAHPNLLNSVQVSYYGSQTPLNQLALVSVLDSHTLKVTPYDKNATQDISKGIQQADLGLNPREQSDAIYVPLPVLSEQRRKELAKGAKSLAEQYKVSVRNIRRDANTELKKLQKNNDLSEDEVNRFEGRIQNLTESFTSKIDTQYQNKEKDLLEL